MSYGGSQKEFVLKLYLKKEASILEKTLGCALKQIQLESEFGGRQVDISAVDQCLGHLVLMEVWLKQSNTVHQEQVMNLLENLEAGTVAYLATDFQMKHLTELRNWVALCGKPIRLVLVQIDQGVLEPLTSLNALNKLDVFDNLHILNSIPRLLEVLDVVEHPSFSMIEPKPIPEQTYDFSSRRDVNQYLIHQLRQKIPQFLAFHQERTLYPQNPILTFGAGASGLMYHCSVRDSRNRAFVELRFADDMSYLYRLFTMKPGVLKRIDERMKWGNNRIGCYWRTNEDTQKAVSEVVEVFEKMIHHISRPLYDLLDFQYEMRGIGRGRTA